MAEYIEREKVYEMLNACGAEPESWADGWDKAIDTAIKKLKDMPAADVAPAIYGHIVLKSRIFGGVECCKCPRCEYSWQKDNRVRTEEHLCSECGVVLAHNYEDYCPHCGAKMDEEDTK